MEIKIEIIANEYDHDQLGYLATLFSALGGQAKPIPTTGLCAAQQGVAGPDQEQPPKVTRHRRSKAELEAETVAAASEAGEQAALEDKGPDTPPAETSEPPKEAATQITEAQVRAKLVTLAKAGKQPQMKALLEKFGAKKLSDIKAEQYAAVLDEADKLAG